MRVFALPASALMLPNVASAEIVVFRSGRTMSVKSYRVDADNAVTFCTPAGK